MFRYQIDGEVELGLLEEQHAEALFALTDRNRAQLRAWLVWADKTNSPVDTTAFIRGALQQFAANNGFQAGIWVNGAVAGTIGLHYVDRINRKTEIGYWLGQEFQGKGIMTRACRALVAYAFDRLDLNRVEIRCARGNGKSRAIPERLGFTRDGALREAEWLQDHFDDQMVYSLLASEWREQRPG